MYHIVASGVAVVGMIASLVALLGERFQWGSFVQFSVATKVPVEIFCVSGPIGESTWRHGAGSAGRGPAGEESGSALGPGVRPSFRGRRRRPRGGRLRTVRSRGRERNGLSFRPSVGLTVRPFVRSFGRSCPAAHRAERGESER
mmetsp:Transcript_10306/g.32836  ORF Transcript_10306/g.32836 Transcript_10306/m.32836 type:complete len:144 (+) Transcript_10306:325-756(+)